jgi:hypothetical protein
VNRNQRVRRLGLATTALSLGATLAVSGLMGVVPVLAAGTGTVVINPSGNPTPIPAGGPGATFSVDVVSNASVATSGVQASVVFDKTVLQITGVTRGSGWSSAPVFIGPPASDLTVAANMAATIASANANGKLATVAASQTSGSTTANVDQSFLTITFQVIGCGSSSTTAITLPTGASDTLMTDTTAGQVAITTTGATVEPCHGNTGNQTTHVTGSMSSGYLSLSLANASVSMPLTRNATNTATENASVFSDGVWTLNVQDATTEPGYVAADFGHMSGSYNSTHTRLAAAMKAQAMPAFYNQRGAWSGSNTYVQYDVVTNGGSTYVALGAAGGTGTPGTDASWTLVPLVSLDATPASATNVYTGNASVAVPVTLSQAVGPSDKPTSYTINLIFTATSGF